MRSATVLRFDHHVELSFSRPWEKSLRPTERPTLFCEDSQHALAELFHCFPSLWPRSGPPESSLAVQLSPMPLELV